VVEVVDSRQGTAISAFLEEKVKDLEIIPVVGQELTGAMDL